MEEWNGKLERPFLWMEIALSTIGKGERSILPIQPDEKSFKGTPGECVCFGRFRRVNDLLGKTGMPIKDEVERSSFRQGKPQTICRPDKFFTHHQWGTPKKECL